MSSVLDEVMCGLEASVAASGRCASMQLKRVGAKKRFVELAAASLDGSERRKKFHIVDPTSLVVAPEATASSEKDDPAAAGQQEEKDADENGTTEQNESLSKKADAVDVEFYQNMIDQCVQEDEKNKKEAAKRLEATRELRRVYMFGLLKVSKLQDLREAPDAIMPGNFVESQWTEQEKGEEKKVAAAK